MATHLRNFDPTPRRALELKERRGSGCFEKQWTEVVNVQFVQLRTEAVDGAGQ
jgi:hypothetical protein